MASAPFGLSSSPAAAATTLYNPRLTGSRGAIGKIGGSELLRLRF